MFWSSYIYQKSQTTRTLPINQEFNTKPLSSIPKHPLLVLNTLAPVYPTRRSRHKHSYFRACQGPPSAMHRTTPAVPLQEQEREQHHITPHHTNNHKMSLPPHHPPTNQRTPRPYTSSSPPQPDPKVLGAAPTRCESERGGEHDAQRSRWVSRARCEPETKPETRARDLGLADYSHRRLRAHQSFARLY